MPSLRDWLTRKQKETRRGRAELRLAERTALWHDRPEYRHLPSAWEYLGIRLFMRRRHWTPVERTMMAKARRVHALKAGLGSLAVVVLASVAYLINARLEDRHASSLVVSLIAADTGNVEKYVDELQKYRTRANPYLMRVIDDPRSTAKATLHARLMLVQDDPAQVEPLFDRLRTAKPTELAVIVRFLKPCQPRLNERLWRVAEGGSESQRLCAAAALADYDPQNSRDGPRSRAMSSRHSSPFLRQNQNNGSNCCNQWQVSWTHRCGCGTRIAVPRGMPNVPSRRRL